MRRVKAAKDNFILGEVDDVTQVRMDFVCTHTCARIRVFVCRLQIVTRGASRRA